MKNRPESIVPDHDRFLEKKDRPVSRRRFLHQTAAVSAGAITLPASAAVVPPSWTTPGADFSNYGKPSSDQERSIRWITNNPSTPGDGVSWSPLHELAGTITPNGLHFERHHNGVPTVDASQYELVVHGNVKRPLAFSRDALLRYPQVSRTCFIECGGNSNASWLPNPAQAPAGYLHGLISNSEWTGVALSQLLEEVGLTDEAEWLVIDGLDAAGVTVSIPISKAMDDVIVAFYQNGEAVRPENGYPARLIVPGWEGIVNVKWLRSIELARQPLMSRFDTVSYTDLQKDGRARRFSFEIGVKSLITSPSPGDILNDAGDYEIRGLAWSGVDAIDHVDVSADGGVTWSEAELNAPVMKHAWVRFRMPWRWDGQNAVLASRATDRRGNVQPTRAALIEEQGANPYYHFNGIVTWSVSEDGSVAHVYV